jgi:CopG family nickel-responsive transcriptional regulator
MPVISISLTSKLLEQLDYLIKNSGYSSRSEAIRLAIRDSLSQYALNRLVRGMVVATVTVISDRHSKDIDSTIIDLRHEFEENIFGNMHLHIGKGYCVEIFMFKGDSETVMEFISKVKTVKGIREVKYIMTPITNSIF